MAKKVLKVEAWVDIEEGMVRLVGLWQGWECQIKRNRGSGRLYKVWGTIDSGG